MPLTRSIRRVLRRVKKRVSPARSGSTGRLQRAEALLARGDVHAARSLADQLYEADPRAPSVLSLRAALLGRVDAFEEQARMLHDLHGVEKRPGPLPAERAVLGQIAATTPGWRPRIPGPPNHAPPASADLVLHIVAESLPQVSNPTTLAFGTVLRAAREAGIRSVVVTGLGFPRRLGQDRVDPVDEVDGIAHHRLDLGIYYPLDGPIDVVLEDAAWLAAAVAREVRPAVLHVWAGPLDLESALVAAAIRGHTGRPLVWTAIAGSASPAVGAESAVGPGRPSGASDRRRRAVERVLIDSADHVIVASERASADLAGRGIELRRVSVLADPIDGAGLRDVYGFALRRRADPDIGGI